DLGRYDEDGYIWIVDRVKDIIISGGVNIYPFEVEQELMKYEPIQDVAVVGVPHPEWGETVKAFYVSDAPIDEADVKAFLSTRLAAHKIPRMYEKIDAIPRNATGKILKHQLRKEYELK
ncbi:MAG: long-chain fatty acid--CoA ligase, partial [Bacillales bacterium]